MQRALMQFSAVRLLHVRETLIQRADRTWGSGCDSVIPANAPKEAIEPRKHQANAVAVGDDHYHTVANPANDEPAGERGLSPKGY